MVVCHAGLAERKKPRKDIPGSIFRKRNSGTVRSTPVLSPCMGRDRNRKNGGVDDCRQRLGVSENGGIYNHV